MHSIQYIYVMCHYYVTYINTYFEFTELTKTVRWQFRFLYVGRKGLYEKLPHLTLVEQRRELAR